ncbi:aspartate aminotransferase family protein [Permianibacter aggregans]|uniref:Putrescine aminotransferase n=1 Tax=Permianibacter aggregans TaxID=1510150 RepID=A0A4R6UVA3_9GAMM|nr:aspartate aminotransferase family protein [Permianibacter aggregans]TDQ51151.1 putrescine aminotransferase [Permianibacter aggregans]
MKKTSGDIDWRHLDASHHLHPFTDNKALRLTGVRVIEKAEGVYLWDGDGNRYLDGFAGLWCVNVGYGRKELIEAAAAQMQQLPYYNLFFKTTTMPAIELAQAICELTPPGLNQVFFTGSGSEANDTVFRMVRRYWDLRGQKKKKVFIARKNAYHGSTVAGASLGGMRYMHEQGDLPIPGIEHIEQPYAFELAGDLSSEAFGRLAAGWLEQKILELGPEHVAAFIGEPIQGAGGVIIPPLNYWSEVEKICRKYDVLICADEVICGFGRLGHWFGCQHFGFTPDFMSIAKGLSSGYLPIGGVVVRDEVAELLVEQGGEFNHGFTYSGHPVCAAVALANLRILREERIVETVRKQSGPYLSRKLAELVDHPLVGEVRNIGLIGAIELVADKHTRKRCGKLGDTGSLCRDMALREGLILRATGDTMLLSPPLIISGAEIDELVAKTRLALDATAAQLGL